MELTLGVIEDICTPRGPQGAMLDMLLGGDPKPPAPVSYWLAKNARHLRSEFEQLSVQKRDLIKSLGATEEKGVLSLLPGDAEATAKWFAGQKELREIEVDVKIHILNVNKLGDFNPGAALFEVFDFMFTAGDDDIGE